MKKVKRNVPASLLRAQINDLSLEDIANSYEFRRILENSINALLYSHNRSRKTSFDIRYEPYSDLTACTDDFKCYMNAAHPMFTTNQTTGEVIPIKDSVKRLYGASFHEAGHILYTCFSEMKRMAETFSEGNLDPGDIPPELEINYEELNDVLKNEKAVVLQGFDAIPIRDFITHIYMNLMNCVEDGRIEKLLLKNDGRFSGLTKGLVELRASHMATGDSWEIEEFNIPVFMNLCLLYAKYGSFGKYEGGFAEFDMAIPIIDKMVECHEAKVFSQYNQMLLLCIWPQIKELIIEASGGSGGKGEGKDGEDGEGNQPDQNGGSKGKGNAQGSSKSGNSSGDAESELEKKLKEILDKISETMSEEPSYQNDAGEESQKQDAAGNEDGDGKNKGNEKENEDGEDDGESKSSANVVESKAPANDTSSTTLEATIDDIMEKIADEKVRDNAMEDACKNAKKVIAAGKGFAPYHGTKVVSVRPASDGVQLDLATEAAIKKAAREIQRHLETDQRVGVSKRKFSGKKFHAEKVVNRDFRYFENKASKKEVPKVAVGLVVDESGSMYSDRRWKNARAAAVTLYKIFEYIPNLDIAIYGHTTAHEVEIYDYADFGIKQKDVEKRLANIQARGGNIDIVPITVMAENLLKQDAETRIMFIITDGLPYSYVRGMTPEQELTEAANAYSRKGIEIIVASIGDDEARLKDIYRNQRFLNISSASDLPKKVVDVIKRKL